MTNEVIMLNAIGNVEEIMENEAEMAYSCSPECM